MKLIIIRTSLILLLGPSTAYAFTVDEGRFFAYVFHPQYKLHIMLSHEKCPLNGKGWDGYAQMTPAVTKQDMKACWNWYDEKNTIIAVCPISIKDNIANLSNCLFVSKEYFRDVTSLPKSAF